jgi:chromosome segregation ATPase
VRAARFPAPDGVAGHVRYTVAAVRFLVEWRRTLRRLDRDLSYAARERDRRLGALGEAARAQAGADARVAAFGATASVIEEEQAAVDHERKATQGTLDRARADLRRDLGALEAQIAEAQVRLAPHATEQLRLEGRTEDLVRARQAALMKLRGLRERSTGAEEVRAAAAEVDGLDADLDALEAELSTCEAEVARHRQALDALRRRHDEVRRAGEARVAELEAAVARLTVRGDALQARRRATLVDLGHELARQPDPRAGLEAPWTDAREGLTRYDLCRQTREQVYAEAGALDRRPIRRTATATALAIGALLLAWLLW